jgi:hypothetical protein
LDEEISMAPDALNDLLNALPPGRRQFLKTVLTGTAFAAPLMASFSMDGLSVDTAAAAICGNMTSNMSVADFVQDPLSCANMTATRKAPRFRARLRDVNTGQHRGELDLELNFDRCAIEYRLQLTDAPVLETVNVGVIGVPAAVLVIQTPPAEYVLSQDRGEIAVTAGGVALMSELLDAFAFGQADVSVKTTRYTATGEVQPR